MIYNITPLMNGYEIISPLTNKPIKIGRRMIQQALAQVNKFSVNFEWLVYMASTMSPSESSKLPDFLEHPQEAIDYYRKKGVKKLIVEHKYMGSRGVIVLCRNLECSKKYFGSHEIGTVFSRKGKVFFEDSNVLQALHQSLKPYMDKEEIDFVILDAEILPWNLKAGGLIDKIFQRSGSCAQVSRDTISCFLNEMDKSHLEESEALKVDGILKEMLGLSKNAQVYNDAWSAYCGDTDEIKIYPFHLIAAMQKGSFINGFKLNHLDQLDFISKLVAEDSTSILNNIEYMIVDTDDPESEEQCIQKWLDYTSDEQMGEGFVFKPLDHIVFSQEEQRILQPAIKCRGRGYLSIIYGIDYLSDLEKLKTRQTSRKRAFAAQENVMAIEAINLLEEKIMNPNHPENHYANEIHKRILGILAFESKDIDIRL